MSVVEILSLVIMGLGLIGSILAFVIELKKGSVKEFVLLKIEEAEKKFEKGEDKLQYVIDEVGKKFKIFKFILDVKAFVEKIISLTKKVNTK